MTRHTLSLEELNGWLNQEFWNVAASSHGNGAHKVLEMNNAGVFRVTDQSKIVYMGGDKDAAIAAYNAAP